jgi:bifunctional non-homologous end joining protein LigD
MIGYRLRVERSGDRGRLITRNGHDWTGRYPWIVESALQNRIKQFVIDGEAVVLGVEASPISTRCTRASTKRCSSMP